MTELYQTYQRVSFTSTTTNGNMSYRHGPVKQVRQQRQQFLSHHGLSLAECVTMTSNSNGQIVWVDAQDANKGMTEPTTALAADALFTTTQNLPLFLLTADCIPLILWSPQHELLALVHLSRVLLDEGFLERVLGEVNGWLNQTTELKNKLGDFYAEIGPCIHKNSYVFESSPVWHHPRFAAYTSTDTATDPHTAINTTMGTTTDAQVKIHIDMVGLTKEILNKAGLLKEQITVSSCDTNLDSNYFSHYRFSHYQPKHPSTPADTNNSQTQPSEGRFATVVYMKKMARH